MPLPTTMCANSKHSFTTSFLQEWRRVPESDARSVERFLVKIGMDAASCNNVVSILAMPNRDVGLLRKNSPGYRCGALRNSSSITKISVTSLLQFPFMFVLLSIKLMLVTSFMSYLGRANIRATERKRQGRRDKETQT